VWCSRGRAGQHEKKTVWHICRHILDSSFVRQFDERSIFVRVIKSKVKNMLAEYFDLSSESDSDSELEIYFSNIANDWCRITLGGYAPILSVSPQMIS
jgi:hypothetical protein